MWILHKETIISKTAKVCIGKDWRIPVTGKECK